MSVWATFVMASACRHSVPVLVTASKFTKLSLAKVQEKISLAKALEIYLSLFAQVWFTLAGLGVICSQEVIIQTKDHTHGVEEGSRLLLATTNVRGPTNVSLAQMRIQIIQMYYVIFLSSLQMMRTLDIMEFVLIHEQFKHLREMEMFPNTMMPLVVPPIMV